jgi:hypothetical protein
MDASAHVERSGAYDHGCGGDYESWHPAGTADVAAVRALAAESARGGVPVTLRTLG